MNATLRTDFDRFLFTSLGDDANGLPVTLMTALARLGVDPWEEAAELAVLSPDSATRKLISRLSSLPSGLRAKVDTDFAKRLVDLLHWAPRVSAPASARVLPPAWAALPKPLRFALYLLSVLMFMFLLRWAFGS